MAGAAFEPNPPEPVAREIETFVKLAQAVGVGEACPMCRNEDWFLLGADTHFAMLTHQAQTGHKAFTLACTRCGYVRQHVKQILRDTAES